MATTITGTTIDVGPNKLLVNSSGNVGVGTSSPDQTLHVMKSSAGSVTAHSESVVVAEANGNSYFSAIGTTGAGLLMANTAGNEIGRINYGFSNNIMQFYTNNAERMRIDGSGNFFLDCTTTPTSQVKGFMKLAGANGFIKSAVSSSGGATHLQFINPNGSVGQIFTSGSGTTYTTSSDYRLKTDVQPMTGAADRVKLLKPCNFEWIVDGTRVDGFIAHEAQEIVPEAVSGTKDAMMDEEYEITPATDTEAAVMGTRSVPDLQGIDKGALIPLLTATIQELITRIEALERA